MSLEDLPLELFKIIYRYKEDLELLERMPLPYRSIACELPTWNTYYTSADYLIMYIVELVTRIDLHAIPFDKLISTPHESLVEFERAANLQEQRLRLYEIDSPVLSPLWRLSLPYIIIEYITTQDIFTLRERLNNYIAGAEAFPLILLQ